MIYILMFYMFMLVIYIFVLFLYFYINHKVIYLELELLKVSSIKMEIFILLDWVSILFISVVLMISLMVIFYSIEYMEMDMYINRFIMMILMFVTSMLMMILSPNLISMLLGWDGLGLVSYCLVIYYQSKVSFNSGMITVLTNRVGDILILMSISLMVSLGSFNFLFLNKLGDLIYFMLMIASFTKSAQIPFSSWLPMAMAAPTPVSSLVHSSTLVTAGVYLMIRLNYLFMSSNLINLMMLFSVMTMFLSGLGANFEFDLKKIIALSTLSQLGVMFFCLSLKLMEMCLFHLLMHAMFKSMLFMCAGVIIHNLTNNQDIRYISMILYNLPLISMMFNCSILSLCGIPFLSGFFSKDLILEMFLMNIYNKFILLILFFSMGLTVMYSVRLIYYSFIKFPQFIIYINYYSLFNNMGISMYMLFLMSIIKGLILSWILFSMKNIIYLPINFKLLIYMFLIMGGLGGYYVPKMFFRLIYFIYCNNYMKFFMMLWFMPMLYSFWNLLFLGGTNQILYYMDLGWIEYLLGVYLLELFKKIFKLNYFDKNYFYLMILFMVIIIMLMF